DKPYISEAQLKKELFKLFNKGKTGKTDLYGVIRTKYTMGRDRYFKNYDLAIFEWQKIQEKAQVEQTIDNAKESLKIGLKEKIIRQLELQSMLEPNYRHEEIVGADIKTGKVIRVMRQLTPKEIQLIHSELSKMDGSYSPVKTQTEIRDLRPLFPDDDELLKDTND
nr:hypothetical protein [Chitinophagales bacterium]